MSLIENLREGDKFLKSARLLKGMAHPLRLEILCGVRREPCTQTRMAEILGVPQSTIAQHLKVLRSLGLVRCERHGLQVVFSLADRSAIEVLEILCGEEAAPEGHTWSELAEFERKRKANGLW